VVFERCLRRVLSSLGEVGESIVGDLRSEHSGLVETEGRACADRWYARNAMGILMRVMADRVRGDGPFHPNGWSARRGRKEMWSMGGLWNELRQAGRNLLRAPQYALAAILTLALAVAANTVVFSVTNSVLLEPLDYPESNRLIILTHSAAGLGYPRIGVSPGLYYQYRENLTAVESSGMYAVQTMNLTSDGAPPERVTALTSTYSLFEALKVPPLLGRGFTEEEDQPGASGTVVLSWQLWQDRFGGDRTILDRSIRVNGEERQVVGVMPQGFEFGDDEMALWVPLRLAIDGTDPGQFAFSAVVRLRPGATLPQLETQLNTAVRRLADAYPDERSFNAFLQAGRFAPTPKPLKDDIVGNLRQPLLILLGTGALVLLIACANVTNLFLVRAENRQRDISVRAALGAGRGLLMRHFLAESVLIALLAGIVGVVLGAFGVGALQRVAPPNLPRIGEVAIRPAVVLYAAGLTAFVAIVLALIPAIRLTRPAVLALVSRSGTRTTAGRERHRARQGLVVVQTALALVLLVGSGLMLRTFSQLRSVDPGFDPNDILTFRLSLPAATYRDAANAAAFHERLLERLRAIPGVQTAGAVGDLPLAFSGNGTSFQIEDHPVGPDELNPMLWYTSVTENYFDVMKIPVRTGEAFDAIGRESTRRAVIVNERLAEHFWPGQNPVGKRLRAGEGDSTRWSVIVGVVGNVHERSLETEPAEMVYYPMLTAPATEPPPDGSDNRPASRAMTFVLRSPRPEALVQPVRDAVWALDPTLPVAAVTTMTTIVDQSMVQTSFTMLALVIAAILALFLGAIGLYGVISYIVTQRTREIGLRIALGAHPAAVRRMIVWQGLRLSIIGLGAGCIVALGGAQVLASMLYGISPFDPVTFGAVVALLGGVGLFATWLPALRASRVDPARALQAE
jgi:putative ABC transport system permease protein